MSRDAAATRLRLLEAATREFAQNGIAGARVDRIAAAAGCNKQLIYAYYGNKDDLFDAVFEAMVIRALTEVPIDVADLPGYAGRLFDGYRRHPEVLRLATWYQLERSGERGLHPAALRSIRDKVEAIRVAQEQGLVADRYPPQHLLQMILALASVGAPATSEAPHNPTDDAALRRAVLQAVEQFVT